MAKSQLKLLDVITSHLQVRWVYQRRFMIEVLFRELKSGMDFGKQQLSKSEERITKSIDVLILAYLFLLKMQHNLSLASFYERQPVDFENISIKQFMPCLN